MPGPDDKIDALPPELAAFIDPYYREPFGTMPPIPLARLVHGARQDPAGTLRAEELRRDALFSDVFDKKTSQLFVVAIMAGTGSPGLPWHIRAARRYGATWEELNKVVEIAAFFRGFGALQDGSKAVGELWQEENPGDADAD